MAIIKVHVLNFHRIYSHIEIVLENTSTDPHTHYVINRWQQPKSSWSRTSFNKYISQAGSKYSFEIDADPDVITDKWKEHWSVTKSEASIVGKNCAAAAQWFLTEFAEIPKPNLSNASWNHLVLGIVLPSFIPFPITLPGRIMSNAKFHIEARNHPEIASQYSRLFLYASMAFATAVFATSIFAITVAATILSGGILAIAIAGCAVVGVASTYGFFRAHNVLSAKNIAEDMQRKNAPSSSTVIQENFK